jgi:ABC-type phosphate transport system substrate-binding protein
MLKTTLLALAALVCLIACQSSPAPQTTDASKPPANDTGIKVSGYVQAGGSSTVR